jgi:hypothetical protein
MFSNLTGLFFFAMRAGARYTIHVISHASLSLNPDSRPSVLCTGRRLVADNIYEKQALDLAFFIM